MAEEKESNDEMGNQVRVRQGQSQLAMGEEIAPRLHVRDRGLERGRRSASNLGCMHHVLLHCPTLSSEAP